MMNREQLEKAEKVFGNHDGVVRMRETLRANIHRREVRSALIGKTEVVEKRGRDALTVPTTVPVLLQRHPTYP